MIIIGYWITKYLSVGTNLYFDIYYKIISNQILFKMKYVNVKDFGLRNTIYV